MKLNIKRRPHGAQVTGFEPWPIFYTSPLMPRADQCLRGGQPVLFPQFAEYGHLKKHGFVRDVSWQLLHEFRDSNQHSIVYSKKIRREEFPGWPHEAEVILDVELRPGIVLQRFEVRNVGSNSYSWTGGLHPYFLVDDLYTARLEGLEGRTFFDRYAPHVKHTQSSLNLAWNDAPCEKLYDEAPPIKLWTGSKEITLNTTGFNQWMIWNPGADGAKSMGDLPDDDWRKFVCIEPVCVDRPVNLEPGEIFTGTFEIEFDPLI